MTTPDGDPKPDSDPWRTPEDPSPVAAAEATGEPASETAASTSEALAPDAAVPPPLPQAAPAYPEAAPGYVPAPGYAQAPPPQPGELYPAQPPLSTRTDGFAIAGFILSILGAVLLSVVFCVLALRRIKRTGTGGRGLAIAGLVISAVWAMVWAAAIVALAFFVFPSRDEVTGQVTESGLVTLQNLQIGDCVENVSAGRARGVTVLPCADPHQAEVVASFDLKGDAYPGETEISAQAEAGCTEALPKTVTDQADETHQLMFVYPLAADWKLGGREVLCIIAVDGPTMTGSFMQGNVS